MLHRDDEVTVIGCVPSCDAPGSWALVAGDGAIRRSLLERVSDDEERPVSHGCINVSLADACGLFDWAPPSLPTGWRPVIPLAAGRPSLWILVTR
jgi:hypothetical protein